jgi:hypothetical protein
MVDSTGSMAALSSHEDVLDVIAAHIALLEGDPTIASIAQAYSLSKDEAAAFVAELVAGDQVETGAGDILRITDTGWARTEAFLQRLATPCIPREVAAAIHAQDR